MSEQTDRFPSLAALQDENDRLLDELEADGQLPGAFWDEVTTFIARGQATGDILDIPNERRAAQSILDYWDNALYRVDRPAPGARLAEFDINLAPDLKDQPCPYRGLAAFDENSAEFFFGRRALIGQMIAKVRDGARLMVVVGPSGSGKSSVVRAGLLRELKRNGAIPGSEGWCYVSMVPGAEPVENLDRALKQAAPEPDQRILVVVDQFEEVFTVCEDPQARLDFEARLLKLLEMPQPEHIVIFTLREDFVDSLSQLGQLYRRYREPGTRMNVEAMDINELREVIEGPAAIVGLRFEEGVVDDLASKVLGERAGLPLLQFTLLQLWEKRRRNRVTKAVYEEVGSPLKALERSADRFYGGLTPESQTTARMILLEMVHPGEGKEFTSSRVPLENVFGGEQSPERVEQVVYRLICEARLVKITGTDRDICSAEFDYKIGKLRELMAAEKARGNVLQIEVAHEALVRNWPQLETWLEEERKALQARWDFRRQAERWAESGERSEWLARGAALESAAAWPNLSALEQRYIRKGRRAQMIDRALRIGALATVIGGALIAALILWQVEYVRRLQVGISRTAAQALIADNKELEERLGWALKAYAEQDGLEANLAARALGRLHLVSPPRPEAQAAADQAQPGNLDELLEAQLVEGLGVEDALRRALRDAPARLLHHSAVQLLAEGARMPTDQLAARHLLSEAAIKDVMERLARRSRGSLGELSRETSEITSKEVKHIIASPDGKGLATLALLDSAQSEGAPRFEATLWNIVSGSPPAPLDPAVVASIGGEAGLIFNHDGSRIAGIGADDRVYLWQAAGGALLRSLEHDASVSRIWFGPTNSEMLASATLDQRFHLWDLASGEKLWELESTVWPPRLAFSDDGRTVAAVVEAGRVCLIDLAEASAGAAPACTSVALVDDGEVSDLTGCPGADCFYAAMRSGVLQLCDSSGCRQVSGAPAADGELHFAPQPYCKQHPGDGEVMLPEDQVEQGNILGSARADEGAAITLAAYGGTTTETWDVTNPISPSLTLFVPGLATVQSVLLRQDCEVIGAVTETGSILYDAATGDVLAQDAIERGDARQLYSSESGIGVASADRDDFVRLWAFARRGDSEPLWRGGYQAGPAVSPDGRWVATVTNEGLRLTDLETRESTPIVLRSDGEQGPDYGMIEDLLLGPGGKLLLWQDFEGNTHLAVRSNDEANEVEMPRFDEQSLSLRNLGLTEEHLVALGPDGIFRFWETADPSDLGLSLPMTLTAPSEVQAFALSLDGQRLATASGAGKGVQIWDLSKDKPSATLVGEGVPALGAIRALALNRDGTQLAVMHDSPKDPAMATPVTVWDTNTGRQVAEISVVEALPELAFGPLETDDGQPRHLITAQGANGITTIYRQFLTVEELADRAAGVANCSLETDCLDQLFRRLRERAQAEAK